MNSWLRTSAKNGKNPDKMLRERQIINIPSTVPLFKTVIWLHLIYLLSPAMRLL